MLLVARIHDGHGAVAGLNEMSICLLRCAVDM